MSISEGWRVPRYGFCVGIRGIDAQRVTRNAPLYVVLAILGAAMIFPFLWMLATSFKPAPDIYSLSLIPQRPTLVNYVTALTKFPFARWFGNSVLVAGLTTLSVAFFDSLPGYVLAKLQFPFKNVIFVAILCTLMVRTELLIIPCDITALGYHRTSTPFPI